jgi:hypothetical protein
LKSAEFGHLSVDIGNYLNSKTTDLVMSATSLVAYNDKPEFIIIIVKRLEIYLRRYNFDLNSAIKFGTYLPILARISRVSYISTLA